MFYDKILLTRTVLATITLIDNIIGQVSNRINLLKITYNCNDLDVQDMVTSIIANKQEISFSVDTKKTTFSGENFLSLIFVDDFDDLR